MTIRRGTAPAVAFVGFDRAFDPGELTGGIQQGDMRIELLSGELEAAGFAVPPRALDRITADGRTFTLQGARAVREGATVIGWSLWVRGA